MKQEFRPARYALGFAISKDEEPVCVYRPNWFARVFGRRKPRFMTVGEAARNLAQAQKRAEEQLIRELFGGH
jgi:hypothetical protein